VNFREVTLLSFAATAALVSIALAGPPATPPSSSDEELKAIFRQTPYGKYTFGDRTVTGVIPLSDSRCSMSAAESLFARMKVKVSFIDETEWSYRATADRALRLLGELGDPAVKGRHVCLGMGHFESPNAMSLKAGYLILDPRLFSSLGRRLDRNALTASALVLH